MQRVSLINSNNTQLNSDHDFTKLWKWLLGNKGGIESTDMFIWDHSSKRLSAGSTIANAYILCTRATSSPIPNQSFLAQFEFVGYLDFLNARNGDKIFIEIKNNLINDPTLIEDLDTQTEYTKGLGIGEIKIAQQYPSHDNYIRLWKIENGQAVDERQLIELPKIQQLQTQLNDQQDSLSEVQSQVTELMSNGSASKLTETLYPLGEPVTKNDCLFVEDAGRIEDITTFQAIGKETANQKVAYRIMGNGVSGNSISLPLCAVGNSPIPLTVRIEGGENQPNGQLVHPQATVNINRSQITGTTSSYTMHTVTFPTSFTIPASAWVVMYQGNNVVNSTNYYGIGLREKHSSTRYLATNNGSWKVLKQNTLTNRENNVVGNTFNDGQKNTWRGVNLTAKNAVSITRIDKINASQANKVRIIKSGAIVGTYNLSGNTATISPAIAIEKGEKFTIEFAKGNNEYYVSQGFNMANSSNGTVDFHDAKYSENGAITGGSNQGYNLNKIFVTVEEYPNNSSVITGAGLYTQVLAKTNASHPYKISGDGYARFSQSAGSIGQHTPVTYYGQHSGMNGLIPGMRYYLSGVPGLITTQGHADAMECGLAINNTTLLTMGAKGKIYSFQQSLTTQLQTHRHPLINQARLVVITYGDYEFHRIRLENFSCRAGDSKITITRTSDTITYRTNSSSYNTPTITFTFYL